jgi:hypothetical protein
LGGLINLIKIIFVGGLKISTFLQKQIIKNIITAQAAKVVVVVVVL